MIIDSNMLTENVEAHCDYPKLSIETGQQSITVFLRILWIAVRILLIKYFFLVLMLMIYNGGNKPDYLVPPEEK